ncbi:hypothetical protein Pyn_10999 [Prunus yedoensis var. nudiflora]|uniref:Uncharacterized protein n=1 Tax=Prunus yedoensis var. nudiflora TaxID=2094558 RepID=A0A314Z293_PRUYE|nr:hypothetical protein Pyn_10999 [Prunus yedoensis var. nudiflora]
MARRRMILMRSLKKVTNFVRPEVTTEVDACGAAGVVIKMITGDDVEQARAIAADCGILKPKLIRIWIRIVTL